MIEYLLAKICLPWLLPPGSNVLAVAAGSVALLRGHRRLGAALTVIGLTTLWLAATPFVAGRLIGRIEGLHRPTSIESTPRADAILVLGGAAGPALPPRLGADLTESSDRLLHAARLYRAGKAPIVIASGGRAAFAGDAPPEASSMAELLLEWGVPREAMVLETESLNTVENCEFSAVLLRERGAKRVLLVTSAAHMERALRVCRRTGLVFIAASTDVRATIGGRTTLLDWLPDAGSLEMSASAIKEFLGLVIVREPSPAPEAASPARARTPGSS